MPVHPRTRLTTAQEAAVIALDKNIRATHYKDPADQREFLDKQARVVVRLATTLSLR